jgi:hypothetical protein
MKENVWKNFVATHLDLLFITQIYVLSWEEEDHQRSQSGFGGMSLCVIQHQVLIRTIFFPTLDAKYLTSHLLHFIQFATEHLNLDITGLQDNFIYTPRAGNI